MDSSSTFNCIKTEATRKSNANSKTLLEYQLLEQEIERLISNPMYYTQQKVIDLWR